jgi:hypothetical protein
MKKSERIDMKLKETAHKIGATGYILLWVHPGGQLDSVAPGEKNSEVDELRIWVAKVRSTEHRRTRGFVPDI